MLKTVKWKHPVAQERTGSFLLLGVQARWDQYKASQNKVGKIGISAAKFMKILG